MLRKYSNSRTLEDNIKLGTLTAFSAGMVNVTSLLIFLSFSSNVTGYYAVLAAEISKGEWFKAAVVLGWILMFFIGSFTSNFIVIHSSKNNSYLAHAIPIIIEIACLMGVGIYGQYFYKETLVETEYLLALMVFAMGLQNGLTASISNFAVKTTHLTGATTDLAILFSMFTKAEYRRNKELVGKAKLIGAVFITYVLGAVVAGLIYFKMQFKVFYIVSVFLVIVIVYDYSKIAFRKKYLRHEIKKPDHIYKDSNKKERKMENTVVA